MIREFRYIDRWQHFRALWNREDYTNELLSRLEERDRALEAFIRDHLAGGRVLVAEGIKESTSTLTLTSSEQDVPGCTVDLPLLAGDVVRVRASVDMVSTSAGGVGVCLLHIAGVGQSAQAIHKGGVANDRDTVHQQWRYDATDDSTVTFKLRALYSSTFSGVNVNTPHTTLSYEVFR